MIRIFYRTLFLLFVLAGGLRSSAQGLQSDVGLWTVNSYVADTQLPDPEDGFLDLSFEEKPGFGVSFNHYWTDRLSTELSLMTFRADVSVSTSFIGDSVEIGEIDARALTAMGQWHFRQGARVMPYLGAGIAHVGGTFEPVDDDGSGDSDLESEVTWAAAAGLDIRLTDRIFLSFEAKKVAWDAVEEGGLPADEIDIDPMLYGSGLRFRF